MSAPAPPALTVRHDGSERTFAAGHDVVVGRDLRADMRITHPLISRAHLLLRFDQGRWLAIDNGSLNGTFVNGRRVPVVDIHDGQSINIGNPDGPQLTFEVGRHQGMAGRPPQTDVDGHPHGGSAVRHGLAASQASGQPGPPVGAPPGPARATGDRPGSPPPPPRRARPAPRPARAARVPGSGGGRPPAYPTSRATAANFQPHPQRADPRTRHRRPRCRPAPPSRQRWRTWRRRCSRRCCPLAPGRSEAGRLARPSAAPPTTTSSSRTSWRRAITRF